jgi:hypothetical protein
MKRSGLLLIAGGLLVTVSFSVFTMAWVDSMKFQSISSQAARGWHGPSDFAATFQ